MRQRPPFLRSGAPAAAPRTQRPRHGLRAWALCGALCGGLLTLALQAPARWLSAAVDQLSQGHVQLLLPRGTVWSGSANLVLTGGQGSQDRTALPGRLDWQLRPALLGLHAELRANCCTPQPLALRLGLGLGRVRLQLDDGASQWPAGLLGGLGTPWNTVQAQGQLQIDTHALALEWAAGRLRIDGQASLQAKDISSRLSTLQPMGSYQLDLDGGDAPTLALKTLDGSLRLSGQGRWVGARLHFEGAAEAAPEREAALNNLLNIIGRRQGARSIISLG